MKRILLLISALMASITALWADDEYITFDYDVKIDGIFYDLDTKTNTACVTHGYEGEANKTILESYISNYYSGDVTIPETITYNSKTYRVTGIDNYAFYYCSIASINIPNSVTSIGYDAFDGCSGLKSILVSPDNPSHASDDGVLFNKNKTVLLTFPRGKELTSYTIPNSVFSIDHEAFKGCSRLTSIVIPNSVTSIGSNAFESCSSLTEVTIGNSVTSIGSGAFYECSRLTSVTWNAKNYKDFSSSFNSPFYYSKITSFTIGNEVEHIPAYLCYGMSNLTKVNYLGTVDQWVKFDFKNYYDNPIYYAKNLYINGELLTDLKITSANTIKKYAFYNCRNIKSVEIGNSVTSIGYDAFKGCSGLTSVIWNVKKFSDFSDYDDVPFYYIRSQITSFTIGNEVERIPAYLCYEMKNLTKVNYLGTVDQWLKFDFKNYYDNPIYYAKNLYINDELLTDLKITSVNTIKKYTFYNCQNIKSVEIGNSVTSIGTKAFFGCSKLTSITIPNSVTEIGSNAFYECSGLTSVIWNVKKFSDFSYYDDAPFYNIRSKITSFTFGNEVEHIPAYLCYEMSKLSEVTIPTSVTSIGKEAFYNCSGLTKVDYLGTVDKWLKFNFKNYYDNPIYYAKNLYINGELLTDLKITSVNTIKKYAFYNCQNIKSVEIGNSVTSIGYDAFKGCSGLTSVIWNVKKFSDFSDYDDAPFYNIRSKITSFTFGNEVEHIPAYLCYGMSKLTEITIPNSVTSIGSVAFYGCSGLTSVIWNAKNYKDFSSYSSSPFYNIRSNITSFTFGNEVEHIPAYLCYYMNNLKEVTIGNSVTSIGSSAFSSCSGLTKVNYLGTVDKWGGEIDFKSSVSNPTYYAKDLYINNELLTDVKITTANSIENFAFYNCQSIKSVEIGNSVTSIGSSAFSGCSGLTKVNYLGTVDKWVEFDWDYSNSNPTYYAKDLYINNELLTDVKITKADSIKKYAFYNCQSIKSVEIGESVTSIADEAFYNCSGLTSVTIGESVTSIGSDAFSSCSGLTSVTIPNSVTTIGSSAFSSCSGLTSVSIGESVTSIGKYAFSGCDKLRKVTAYPTTVPNVYENSFAHYNAALYVPCDVYDDYFFDAVFGSFKVTECIAAEEVDAPEKVEIEVDEDNNANVIWPSTDGAKKYELEISKDGEVFCTLLFNENGQLTSIDFGNRSASVGFQFTVTGLDSASKYAYSMVAMDKKGNELQSYKGTFTTNGYVPGPGEEDVPTSITETLADANITVSGGTISADADFSIYNTIGLDVTAFNGSLQSGVYLVSIENNIVKVMVK